MAGFVLTSPSFAEGGAIPEKHSCDGQNLSPALNWDGAPIGTAVFALIVDDTDANGFVHWVAFNIAGGRGGGLAEGVPAAGPPTQGRNSFGNAGYGGPCPPSGTHHYRFTLFALSQPVPLVGTPTSDQLRAAMATGNPPRPDHAGRDVHPEELSPNPRPQLTQATPKADAQPPRRRLRSSNSAASISPLA